MTVPRSLGLEETQRWMQAVVMHPKGITAGLDSADASAIAGVGSDDVTALVTRSNTQTAEERLRVYGYAYFARLINVLKQDYSALSHALDEDAFAELAKAYLVAHPSNHYNLNVLGARLPSYLLEERTDLSHHAFLAELAQLERAIQDVFDERRADAISAEAIWDLPEELWYDTRLVVAPACRLFAFQYPVNQYLQQVRDKTDPAIPTEPEASWVMVYRHDWTVYRADLSAPRYALIRSLANGDTLGTAIEATLDTPGADPEQLVGQLREWFRLWTGFGVFAAIETPSA